VTVDNFFAVLLGNKSAVVGGSGKVVDSGPNDHIFIFYSDHGGPGVLGIGFISILEKENQLVFCITFFRLTLTS
jgi:hypothetical protein